MVVFRALALSACTLAACLEPDNVVAEDPLPQVDLGGALFADAVISDTQNGVVRNCVSAATLVCGGGTGPCDPHPAIGPNDGKTFSLGPSDRLEVAFRCGIVRELGLSGSGNELKIWATVPDNMNANVEVSFDDDHYSSLPRLETTRTAFDLQTSQPTVDRIRFVRISWAPPKNNAAPQPILIDAIEGLTL